MSSISINVSNKKFFEILAEFRNQDRPYYKDSWKQTSEIVRLDAGMANITVLQGDQWSLKYYVGAKGQNMCVITDTSDHSILAALALLHGC